MKKKTIVSPEASFENQRMDLETDQGIETNEKPKDETSPAHEKALRKLGSRQDFVTMSDQIAQHALYHRNYKYPNGWKYFPANPEMHQVTKYYPLAVGGPLLVDEPRTEWEMVLAYEKQKTLKKSGLRHIVIEKDSTMEDLWEQLGEF